MKQLILITLIIFAWNFANAYEQHQITAVGGQGYWEAHLDEYETVFPDYDFDTYTVNAYVTSNMPYTTWFNLPQAYAYGKLNSGEAYIEAEAIMVEGATDSETSNALPCQPTSYFYYLSADVYENSIYYTTARIIIGW